MNAETKYTIALETLGCKVNQAESEILANQIISAGHRVVAFDSPADAYLINTCTVTHVADRKGRQLLSQARRTNPAGITVGLGCGAKALALQADMVISNSQKHQAVSLITQALRNRPPVPASQHAGITKRTRGFVKVQDGCNHWCSYCIVPLVRGAERSVPSDEVVEEVIRRVQDGCREVVITGPQLGTYSDRAAGDLAGLVKLILKRTSIERLRLSSIEPHVFNDRLLELWPNNRICQHLHIPLQSGSDSLLSTMGRDYTTGDYFALIKKIRNKVPMAAITTDVICGFPGETDAEHTETESCIASLEFAKVHVFTFSDRPGTKAYLMGNKISPSVRRQRRDRLMRIAKLTATTWWRKMVGQTVEVLFEQKNGTGQWSGLTGTYARVSVENKNASDLTNEIRLVKLIEVEADGLFGILVDDSK
jgi:threonylcarbamoyladenosine tRNA methylthiotransferase MtaB